MGNCVLETPTHPTRGGRMLTGKGIYVWRIADCDGGDTDKIVERCVNAKFSHVLIKIADGVVGYNWVDNVDKAKELAIKLKAKGIAPWGWQYVYGNDPVTEANVATRRMKETGCVGFVINAEHEYRDAPDGAIKANQYVNGLLFIDEMPIALSTYRYPEVHPTFPYRTFLAFCNIVMPQVYWMEANNPAEQLLECICQYEKFTDLPIFPTGSAFAEHGWCPEIEEIKDFAQAARDCGLAGINFWEYACCRKDDLWQTVRDIVWDCEPEPPEDEIDYILNELTLLKRAMDNTTDILEAHMALIKINRDDTAKLKSDMVEAKKEIALNIISAKNLLAGQLELAEDVIACEKKVRDAFEDITTQAQEIEDMRASIDGRIDGLEGIIEEIELQNNHIHPAWMVRWGLVRQEE